MEEQNLILLQKFIDTIYLTAYPRQSRIHLLKSYHFPHANVYIKRDDELGFGLSGSKVRKYLSLIPFLINENYKEVIVLGGAYSNNVLSAVQLLREKNISPILFLDGEKQIKEIGNFLLTSLFIKKTSIHWLKKDEQNKKNEIVDEYIFKKKKLGTKVGIIKEGANMKEALPGALTLCLDIIKNERENKICFDHIFIDSGTGLMAISLILGYTFLSKKAQIHVLQVAGTETEFKETFHLQKKYFEELLKKSIHSNITFDLYKPHTAKSFGATNSKVFQTIVKIARDEGILTDPIYSAKLFLEAHKIIKEKNLTGNILIIHSGGGLSLFGFQTQLQNALIEKNY